MFDTFHLACYTYNHRTYFMSTHHQGELLQSFTSLLAIFLTAFSGLLLHFPLLESCRKKVDQITFFQLVVFNYYRQNQY